jgi:hypothetical protein
MRCRSTVLALIDSQMSALCIRKTSGLRCPRSDPPAALIVRNDIVALLRLEVAVIVRLSYQPSASGFRHDDQQRSLGHCGVVLCLWWVCT